MQVNQQNSQKSMATIIEHIYDLNSGYAGIAEDVTAEFELRAASVPTAPLMKTKSTNSNNSTNNNSNADVLTKEEANKLLLNMEIMMRKQVFLEKRQSLCEKSIEMVMIMWLNRW